MDTQALIDGLLMYICLVVIVTFHEFGHAWMALRMGDVSQREQGRVTLNPLAHLDTFGTVILPLFFILANAFDKSFGGFLFGWGKPVMVDLNNLTQRRRQSLWITLAGPAMNVVLTALVLLVARGAAWAEQPEAVKFCLDLAILSMFLFFFNLLPVPPLDGGNALHSIIGMKEETYLRLSQMGWIFILILINIRPLFAWLAYLAVNSVKMGAGWVGLG
ncbi:site-2 protease family protein [Fontisphaera persica]|uniref:site-2 protease family protein n=1 Tax=Fontisphaera persica TaxID=2974023 RepID=UPI0024BF5DDC|nr:site-2 protease family protein [Fontisphaera persica]WCJ60125.1 site-2 protease family protein [Fontisphaera persica]